ncbi:MAG: sigma-70 family RNA polymerase sigma factor [Bacillota bacterium]
MNEAELLYRENVRLASFFAGRFVHRVPPQYREDVFAEAQLGLWKACTRFDPRKGRFSTFAARYILNEICGFISYLGKAETTVSIEAEITGGDSLVLGDLLGYEQDFSAVEVRNALKDADEVFRLYFGGLTQDQIADRIKCSQAHVSRRIKKARARLAAQLRG